MTATSRADDFAQQRQYMIEHHLRARGVQAPAVLAAMARVPREHYVPASVRRRSYDDSALPIAAGQTISQPFIVGYMVEALQLQGGDRVLEVGTGSGYAAAVLAEIAAEVFTIERHSQLADAARQQLDRDGYRNVTIRTGDGSLGWPEQAPFDAIVVAAGTQQVPPALRAQLAIGGRLLLPIGPSCDDLHLQRITRTGPDDYTSEQLAGVRFVPLIRD